MAKIYYKMLEALLFWPAWQRWFLTFIISSFLIICWYLGFYKPLAHTLQAHQQEYIMQQQEVLLVENLRKNIRELESKIDNLRSRLPLGESDQDTFSLEHFFSAAAQNNLTLEKFSMAPEQQREQLSILPFECTYKGNFFDVNQFLENLMQQQTIRCISCALTKRHDKTIACLYKGEILF